MARALRDASRRRLPARWPQDARAELLLRSEELRDALWDVCDAKLDEAGAERAVIEADSWLPDHLAAVVAHFVALVQLEARPNPALWNARRPCAASGHA